MLKTFRYLTVFLIAVTPCGLQVVLGVEGDKNVPIVREEGAMVPPPGFRWPAPIPGCVERPLAELLMPLDDYNDIVVFTGTGRRVARLGPKKDEWEGVRTIYASPGVHPDQDRIVAVKCLDVPPPSGDRLHSGPCAVVEIRLDSGGEHSEIVLYQAPHGPFPYAPSYSPDGSRIAFFMGPRLVILNRDLKTLEERIETGMDRGPSPISSRDDWWPTRIFWSSDQNYLVVRWGGLEALFADHVFVVDLRARQIFRIPDRTTRPLWSDSVARQEAAKGPWGDVLLAAMAVGLRNDLYAHYWVSPEPLGWTPCRRYFWYFYRRDGFFAFSALRRYDMVEHRPRNVKVLDWALYRK